MNKQEMMRDTHIVDQFMPDKAFVPPISMSNRTFDVLLSPYMHQYSGISPVA